MEEKTDEQIRLEEYLRQISTNLYSAISSLYLFKTIGETSTEIEEHNFGNSMFTIQRVLLNDVILSISKIFEENKDSINIEKIHTYISSNQRKIPLLEPSVKALEKYKLFDFTYLETFEKEYKLTFPKDEEHDEVKITNKFQAFTLPSFLKCLESSTNSIYEDHKDDIAALKEIRDRVIAHTDKRPVVKKTTWEQVDKLIDFVKEYIDMMDFVFHTIVHSGDDGESYEITASSAKKPCRNLLKLLKTAGVIDKLYKDYYECC